MLRPTFLGFETARRGIAASQKAMDIAGNNLTNWNTPGYTRQRMDQVSIATSDYSSRFASNRIGVAGQGVEITGIGQVRDSFLDKRYRDEYGNTAYYDQKAAMLSEIEDAISEFDPDTGIMGGFKVISQALNDFISHPDSETSANTFASAAKSFSLLMRQFSQNLDNVADQQKYNLKLNVDEMNTAFSRLADLNKIISEDVGVTGNPPNQYYGPNELLDEQNLLLDQLSAYGDLDITRNSDGTVLVKMGGKEVVNGNKAESAFLSTTNDNGTVSLSWESDGKAVNFTKGGMMAALEVINGRGPGIVDANESIQKGIPYYRDKINALAATFAQVFNNTIPEKVGADGKPIPEPDGSIKYKNLMGARVFNETTGKYESTTDIPITAANLTISDTWNKNSAYVIVNAGEKSTNGFALNLQAALFTTKNVFNTVGESYTGTFSKYVEDYAVSSLGTEINFNAGRAQSHGTIQAQIEDQRDSVSGVSQDEETTNLLMYNRTFQAASRLMNTLDEALDQIINRMGLVGR